MYRSTYGYWIFEADDESNTEWMPKTIVNWQRVDVHNHDGFNSPVISASATAKGALSSTSAQWSASGSGYLHNFSLPGAFTYANTYMRYFVVGGTYDKCEFWPTTIPTSANSFDLYCSDNSIGVIVIYN